jgi:hypothetical protein
MEDPEVNIVLTLELQMINKSLSDNYRNEGCRIHKSEVGISRVLAKLGEEFSQSSNVFAQSLDLLTKLIEVSVQSIDELT